MQLMADLIVGLLEWIGIAGQRRDSSEMAHRVVPAVTTRESDRSGTVIPVEIVMIRDNVYMLVTDRDIPSKRDLTLHLSRGSDRIEVQSVDSHLKAEVMRASPKSKRSRRKWSRMTDAELRAESRSVPIYQIVSDPTQIRKWLDV